MKAKRIYIAISIALACAVMAWVETGLQPGYLGKSAIKIALFAGAALGYQLRFPGELSAIFRPQGLKSALWLGAGIYGVILAAFFLVRPWLDLEGIAARLLDKEGVDRYNFLPVALYISLCNSLLEELLFRGLGFLMGRSRWAGGFSAAAFAAYHVGILEGWMNGWLFGLCMAGLFLGGLIFNWLDRRGSILPSWVAHGAANLAINTVGLMAFGLV